MVKMTTVWERTSDFLREHGRALLPVAAGLVFLPNLVSGMFESAVISAPDAAALYGVIALAVTVVVLWGSATVTAMAIRPSSAGPAIAHAGRRLLPIIGVTLIVLVALMLLGVPFVMILVASGVDMAALSTPGASMPQMGGGAVAALLLYMLVVSVLVLWLTARLSVLGSVILAERRGIGAIARSFELTRGHALRIIGLLLLYAIVAGIATVAVGAVAGLIGLLLAGGAQGFSAGTVVVALASAIVATLLTVVQSAFVGKLYTQLAPATELQDTFG